MTPRTVRREPTTSMRYDAEAVHNDFDMRGILDLAAGRHAVGCECATDEPSCQCDVCLEDQAKDPTNYKINGCLAIAHALRDFAAYDVEEETT